MVSFSFLKKTVLFTILIMLSNTITSAQVGINTISPKAAIDIESTDSGILIPRIALNDLSTAAPVINPDGGVLVDGTMIWNTGTGALTETGFYYWESGKWNLVTKDSGPQVFFGKLILTSTGNELVEGIPFMPSAVEFLAVNRVQNYDDGAYRSNSNNSNDVRMAAGMTMGYAQASGTNINQQVISNGFNGASINNIATYSSDSHCIAAFFVNNNADPIHDNGSSNNGAEDEGGLISASLTSFNNNGFTLNVDRFLTGSTTASRTNQIVVIFKAYR